MRGNQQPALEHMSDRSGALTVIMRARCPDRAPILQVSRLYNETLVLLNCLDGGQDGSAQCQVSPGGNGTGNQTKNSAPLLTEASEGGRRAIRGPPSCSSRLAGRGPGRRAGPAPLEPGTGLQSSTASGCRVGKPGLGMGLGITLKAQNLTGEIKTKSLHTSPTKLLCIRAHACALLIS